MSWICFFVIAVSFVDVPFAVGLAELNDEAEMNYQATNTTKEILSPDKYGAKVPYQPPKEEKNRAGWLVLGDPATDMITTFTKAKGASFRQVVVNAMRFFTLDFELQPRDYETPQGEWLFKLCRGKVNNLKALEMSMDDGYFEVDPGKKTVTMVVKDLYLLTDLHFDFAVKLYGFSPCAGDSGMIRVALTGSIKMGFGPGDKGVCEYSDLEVKIVKVWQQTFPAKIIKLSAKKLTEEKDLVPQIGRHATEQMCNEFRTLMNPHFAGEKGAKADNVQVAAASGDGIGALVVIGGMLGGIFFLSIPCCCYCLGQRVQKHANEHHAAAAMQRRP